MSDSNMIHLDLSGTPITDRKVTNAPQVKKKETIYTETVSLIIDMLLLFKIYNCLSEEEINNMNFILSQSDPIGLSLDKKFPLLRLFFKYHSTRVQSDVSFKALLDKQVFMILHV
jgi:hypothetical protein